jgi:hypothetical protein
MSAGSGFEVVSGAVVLGKSSGAGADDAGGFISADLPPDLESGVSGAGPDVTGGGAAVVDRWVLSEQPAIAVAASAAHQDSRIEIMGVVPFGCDVHGSLAPAIGIDPPRVTRIVKLRTRTAKLAAAEDLGAKRAGVPGFRQAQGRPGTSSSAGSSAGTPL